MNKLKSAVLYECSTKIKAMGIFYLIQYLIVGLIFAIIAISTGGYEIGSNALEFSSLVFVSIVGVLGYQEDFKALIQNGYTRRYIFFSTICMFIFIAGTMAFIDCTIGNTIHYFNNHYFTIFGSFYGYGHLFFNWLWLTVLYLMFCSLFYFSVLVINMVGKFIALLIGVGFSGLVLLTIALFQFVLSPDIVHNIAEFMMRAMGFMSDGTIQHIFPVISYLVVGTVLWIGSYAIIRHTELK